MAKYYIQSGAVNVVVTAVDAEAAALFVLNQTINKLLPADANVPPLGANSSMTLVIRCLEMLGNEFHISEVGFGHHEVAIFDTELLFKRWCELMTAMNELMDQIEGRDN